MSAAIGPCERCGYRFDWAERAACPVCGLNKDLLDWPMTAEEWARWNPFEGDPEYPTDAQLDVWRFAATLRMNVEYGLQMALPLEVA